MKTQPIRILIADDHAIFRDGLRRLLVTQDILRQSNSSFAVVSARLPCASGWLETLADAVAGPQSPASSVVDVAIHGPAEEILGNIEAMLGG